ncbi:mandelate racemase/muconate lactonizing enzyme family protein [Allofustis seminis]|uniref:mandelate racemase/muconate lactonizing enzyme family protein n=1 Tax=Allofustis seminis TaxID=166939 RepID=UPI00037709C6|nr:dipeptide epimerase [Allofustis seminis]
MKITKISFKRLHLVPVVNFKIASSDEQRSETIIVKVETDEGIVGYGESQPSRVVTGNSIEEVECFLADMDDFLRGENPLAIGHIHDRMNRFIKGKSSGKAGIDLALYDILGKKMGAPVYQLIGGASNQIASDITIGIDEPQKMAALAQKYVAEGYRILKIKIGIDPVDDVEAIRLIREAVGPEISLRVDANQGYHAKQAVQIARAFETYHVDEIEQPVPWHDLEGLKKVTQHAQQLIMADESVLSPQDASRVVKMEACDVINIKLMKSGGLYPALQINAIAQAAGLECMVGCMTESRIGIAAGAALAVSQKNISYADLDSYLLMEEVPGITGGFTQSGGIVTVPDAPGLGLHVDLQF